MFTPSQDSARIGATPLFNFMLLIGLWATLAPLAHTAVIRWIAAGEWNGSTPMRYYEYVPVYVTLAIWMLARHTRLDARWKGRLQ